MRDVESLIVAVERFERRWIKWHRNLSLAEFVIVDCAVTGLVAGLLVC